MKLLIVNPKNILQSPTFIQSQVRNLDPHDVLYGGYRPYRTAQTSIFPFPLSINVARIFVKRLIPGLYAKLYCKSFYLFLRKKQFDVVLCNFGPQGSNIADGCYKAGIPFLVHFHGYDAFVHKTLKDYATAYRNMFEKASYVIAVSEDMRKQLIKLGASPGKVILRPYGVDTTLFTNAQPAQSTRTLLFTGRFTAKKDPVLLLKAFHLARQTVPDAQLVMVGKGELYDTVISTIQQLDLQDAVEIKGWQTSVEIAQQMQRARAYAQHSVFAPNGDSEGSPVAIIEAAGSGLPVISTRHAGIKESVIENITGYLVDEGDWKRMAEYMIKLLNDPELAQKMGQAGRKHILDNYDIKQQMAELQDVLGKAVSQKEESC